MLSRFSPFQLLATLWTVAHQALLFLVFSRQEYWSGLPSLEGSRVFPTYGQCLHLFYLLHRQVGSLQLALPGKPYRGCLYSANNYQLFSTSKD